MIRKHLYLQKYKKAALIGAAFCLSAHTFAEPKPTVKSIEKARELLLAGKREKALSMVNDLIGSEKEAENRQRLLREGQKLATFFITESGQKLFELGESMNETNPELAEEKYRASLNDEGPNLKILNSLSLLKLKEKNCVEASRWNKEALKAFNKMIESQAIGLQIMACNSDFEGISKKLNEQEVDSPLLKLTVVKILMARSKIQNDQVKEGLEMLREASEVEPSYPELWYWRWKLDPEDGYIQGAYLEKYITICKKMTPRLKRDYRKSSVVCMYISEAEKALKRSGADSDETVVN